MLRSDSNQASMFVFVVFYYIDHHCSILLFYYIILQFVFIDAYSSRLCCLKAFELFLNLTVFFKSFVHQILFKEPRNDQTV